MYIKFKYILTSYITTSVVLRKNEKQLKGAKKISKITAEEKFIIQVSIRDTIYQNYAHIASIIT